MRASQLPGAATKLNTPNWSVNEGGPVSWIWLAGEVGGQFSLDTTHFLRCLASERVPEILQRRAHVAAPEVEFDVGRAFAVLSENCSLGVDGPTGARSVG